MTPLTDHERESLVPALELCAELGIDTGWKGEPYTMLIDPPKPFTKWSYRIRSDLQTIEKAARYDYRSICEAIADWLAVHYSVTAAWHLDAWSLYVVNSLQANRCSGGRFMPGQEWRCKLAALTAAAKGVGK